MAFIGTDFFTEVSKGNVAGHTAINVFGAAASGGSTKETVWMEGGLYKFPPSGSSMTLSSSSPDDSSAGIGARSVLITFLDSNYDLQTEIIPLNGISGVTTVSIDIFRINLMQVISSGSSEFNQGNIYIGTGTVTAGKPANVFGIIHTNDENLSHMAIYTVPKDKEVILTSVITAAEGGRAAQTFLYAKPQGIPTFQVASFIIFQSFDPTRVELSPKLPEKTDLDFRCQLSSGSGFIKASFFLLQFDKES